MKWLPTLLVLWACVIPLSGYASQRSPQPPNPEGSEGVSGEEVDNTVIVIEESPVDPQKDVQTLPKDGKTEVQGLIKRVQPPKQRRKRNYVAAAQSK